MTTTRLIIARHGNTFGPGDMVTRVGKTDLPLVEGGIAQGTLLGQYLADNALLPDVIYTSNLQRTIQTAEAAQKSMGTALPLEPLDIFNEIDYGPDENQPEDVVLARLGEDPLKLWDAEAVVPDGWNVDPEAIVQNWKDFATDISEKHAGKTILVVTSNGIARFAPYLTGDFDGFRSLHKIKISTGALCIFEHAAGQETWSCKAWNLKPKDYVKAA